MATLVCLTCGWMGSGHVLCPRCTEPLRCEDGLHAFRVIHDKAAIGKRCQICGHEEWVFIPKNDSNNRSEDNHDL